MAMKEQIDIEELLRWAYQRQKIDRVARQAAPRGPSLYRSAISESLAALGCRVDNPTPAHLFGMKVPPDAEIIHDAVLRLDVMFIDIEGGVWTRERIERIGGLLVRDGGNRFWLEIDGEQSPLECAWLGALLIIHAKAGTRPEWCEGWVASGAAKAGDRAERDARGRKRAHARAFTPEDVAFYRAEYQCWRAALVLLAAQLDGALKDFEPLPPGVADEPWRGKKKAA